ncbi:unnamed protein product [Soboliphyme baturini]|uniref:PDZ domain-containing protein n=1 Tax=Soboliphyme baturini TaxID=241478 RepID=A0A183ILZ0_9BILA|nr:unnamed protein product [Soboliphyme baturini]
MPSGLSSSGLTAKRISTIMAVYPSLTSEYMDLKLQPPSVEGDASASVGQSTALTTVSTLGKQLVAPVTGLSVGFRRAVVTNAVRQIVCCKDGKNEIGVRLHHVNNGVFVQFVKQGSPAALAGLRFGDQILLINGKTVSGWSGEKAMQTLKRADSKRIELVVRDRPFERVITLTKDNAGHCGFLHKDGCIKSLVKDSSAAKNGLLIDHQILEVNGQNVIGMSDKKLSAVCDSAGDVLTLTIIPREIYDHIVKCMSLHLVKKHMDHSVPDVC